MNVGVAKGAGAWPGHASLPPEGGPCFSVLFPDARGAAAGRGSAALSDADEGDDEFPALERALVVRFASAPVGAAGEAVDA